MRNCFIEADAWPVLSRHIDDLEPTLTRNGYRMKDLVEQFNAKAHEFKSLFNNTLDPERASELRDKMLAARHSTAVSYTHLTLPTTPYV